MTPTLTLNRFCCPDCGGRHVETLDWVGMNGDEVIGGDLGANFWCPDCESHPTYVTLRDVVVPLCLTCAAHAWGSQVPLPGVWVRADGSIERCERCDIYGTELAAAHALRAELARRGNVAPRVAIFVPGLGAA
ncbi:MAG TPA: hypothetical protein VLC09_02885 [Polyangiaceae bacterium]|nr:hypothetical protein [Polyangiaceae bacterium]